MKRETDDLVEWSRGRANRAEPYPYVFPQMPPRFRRCCGLMRALLLLEYGSAALFAVSCLVAVPYVHREAPPPVLSAVVLLSVPLAMLFWFLQRIPRFFWRCRCCGQPFPYYAPTRGGDGWKNKDCLNKLNFKHIPYYRPRLCPLAVPSSCPECGKKFFEMKMEQIR